MTTIAGVLSDQRDELILDMVALTRQQIEDLHFEWPMMNLLEASITENIVTGLHYLENDIAIDAIRAPVSALTYARELAQRDVPLSALSRAYRIGFRRFLDYAVHLAESQNEPDRGAAVAALVDRSMRFVDTVVHQVEVAYEQERDLWMSSRGGLRQRWLAKVLDGSSVDIDSVERALGYRFDGTHVAAELWPDADVPTSEAMRLFDETARVLAPRLGAIGAPLLVPATERQARIWFRVRDGRSVDATALEQAIGIRSRVRIAVGQPARGVAGFRQTMTQATQVRQIAAQGDTRVLAYCSVTPLALMLGDLDELQSFVSNTLGGLAANDSRTHWLRETLRIFLMRERSYSATADELGRHRNTIQYRVQQATDLCAGDLDDPDHRFDVQVALYVARWLGPVVLPGSPRNSNSKEVER